MQPTDITRATFLTYCGTLPLIACVITLLAPVTGVNSAAISTTYGAIILSFLCGIHWAIHLFYAEKCPRNLLFTSNVVALLAWSALLMSNHATASVLLAMCFIYMLLLDVKLRDAGVLPAWFYTLRRNATFIVVMCLALLAGLA
jgi:predicted lysophospholipase L1 biosynthesis ABC-type transport system permease subunit